MNIGVIFAGGVGSRMHTREKPKQFLKIQGHPIIVQTIRHFQSCEKIDAVVVVCVKGWIDYLQKLVYDYRLDKVKRIVPGGDCGQMSIYYGLCAAKQIAAAEPSIVLIHDGVRPLISTALINENIACVLQYGNCITGARIKETITEVDDEGKVTNITDRSRSMAARAPQSFWLDDILAAHEQALGAGKTDFIDSCSMMRYYGYELHVIEGPSENIKITTPDDFYLMRSILQLKEDEQLFGMEQDNVD